MLICFLVAVIFLQIGSIIAHQDIQNDENYFAYFRGKRQLSTKCNAYEYQCLDGTCIEDYLQCNGVADCPDRSDETLAACQSYYCPPFAFRCSYGACIAGKLECNGHSNCVDDSDELSLNCPGVKEMYSRKGNCSDDNFQCTNGQCVHEDEVCNGRRDCTDGSEETATLCSTHYCPTYAFRCAYGGCVPGKSRCNGVYDCVDGSDETQALCGRAPPQSTTSRPPVVNNRPPGSCSIPSIDSGRVISPVTNGTYRPTQFAQNGERLMFVCDEGTLVGVEETYCIGGEFISATPKCIKGCSTLKLDTLSIRATCADKNLNTIPCTEIVPPTTVARLVCKTGYKKPAAGGVFEDLIHCLPDGNWNHHVGRCEPVCGEITFGVPYISGGRVANISQVPWHVAIYEKQGNVYNQICGGSIISQTAVLSAAHCFWDIERNTVKDVSMFAVIAGKSLRDYNEKEPGMQTVQIQEIRVQAGYLGNENLFIGDIAVLRLMSSIIYQTFIAPICISFLRFAAKNVATGTSGRIAGWGVNEENTNSPVLKVIDLEAVDYNTCATKADRSFVPYILPDKFCATRMNENVCQGDSGGGFTEAVTGADGGVKYYLRGLVSIGSKLGQVECRANRTYTTFTNVLYYDDLFYEFTQV